MSNRTSRSESEVACTLSEDQLAERRKELRGGIVQRIRRVRELSDGYAFGLDLTETDETCAREFVAFESRCCSFAKYEIERDEADQLLWLNMRGPAGTREFISQLLPPSISIERMRAGDAGRSRSLLRAGFAGVFAALIAIVCCATPFLGIALGVIGLGAAVASASMWLDAVALSLLVISLLAIAVATWRGRTARQV